MARPDQRPERDLPRSEPHKTTNPLIWILLILALLAMSWFGYHRMRAAGIDTSAPIPAPAGAEGQQIHPDQAAQQPATGAPNAPAALKKP